MKLDHFKVLKLTEGEKKKKQKTPNWKASIQDKLLNLCQKSGIVAL